MITIITIYGYVYVYNQNIIIFNNINISNDWHRYHCHLWCKFAWWELEPVGNCEIELERMQNCFNPNSRFDLDSNGIYNYLSNLYQHFLHCVFFYPWKHWHFHVSLRPPPLCNAVTKLSVRWKLHEHAGNAHRKVIKSREN